MFAITRIPRVLLTTAAVLTTTFLSASAEKLVPAGTLIQCTVSETKLSSKTVAIGDPVLCQVGRSGTFPSGSVLSGRFEDFKDPGHLVGKGWMELVFDRMIFPSNDIVPVSSKVVAVPHYSVDLEGKILGKGHATRDSIEWLIPVLWPIDVINLPRRGPRPTLKNESRITIKVMDDLVVPDMAATQHNQYGFAQRAQPISYMQEQPVEEEQLQEQAPPPVDNGNPSVISWAIAVVQVEPQAPRQEQAPQSKAHLHWSKWLQPPPSSGGEAGGQKRAQQSSRQTYAQQSSGGGGRRR
jgi:hypothetical protein